MSKIMISLAQIGKHRPREEGWRKLIKAKEGLAYDTPFPVSDILATNGLLDTVWKFRCFPEHIDLWRKYAVWCARQVMRFSEDIWVENCVEKTEQYLADNATRASLKLACDKARSSLRSTISVSDIASLVALAAARTALQKTSNEVAIAAFFAVECIDFSYLEKRHPSLNFSIENKLRQILDTGEWSDE